MQNGTWRGIVVAIGLAGMAAAACKDDGGPSAQDAPEAIAHAACDWFYACDCENLENARFSSIEDCRLEIAGEVQDGIDEGEAAGLTYQAECAQLVIDAIDALGCASVGDLFLNPDLFGPASEIEDCKLFHGDRDAGESCTALDDSNGDDCLPQYACIGGVCRVVANDLGVGEPCEPQDSRCSSGLVCLDINGGNDHKCEELPRGGETCKGTLDLCAVDYYCDQGTKTCTGLPTVGDACAPFPNYLQMTCAFNAICENDSCVAAPEGGEACVITCAEGFACDNGVCVVAPAVACLYVPFV